MKRICIYLAALLLTLPALADEKALADSAYAHEDFTKAAQIYTQLLDSCGSSAQLYYNLGNCYYRQDSIARAILCYERARLLDPADDDVRMNLEMARAKTVDRVMPVNEMFFVALFHRLVLSLSLQTWAWLGLLTFLLMLCAIAAYFFLPTLAGKKAGFTVAVIALLVCVFANLAAYQQLHQLENRTSAVIMSSSVVVKSTPSQTGTDLFILHEGTRVEIDDNSMKEWVEIQMNDGKQGWIRRADIEAAHFHLTCLRAEAGHDEAELRHQHTPEPRDEICRRQFAHRIEAGTAGRTFL